MGLDDGPKFTDNMMTIVNWGGIPADTSREVAEVLSYHVDQMKRMDPKSIEFKCALEAAKVMDAQVHEIRMRESVPGDHVWFGKITFKPLEEEKQAEPEVSLETQEDLDVSDDPKTTETEGCVGSNKGPVKRVEVPS